MTVLFALAPVLFCAVNFVNAYRLLTHQIHVFVFVLQSWRLNTLVLPPYLVFCAIAGLLFTHSCEMRTRRWFRLAAGFYLATGVGLLGLRIYAMNVEPWHPVVRKVTIETAKTDRPLRLLHLSDIQSPRVGQYEDRVFAMAAALKPDLVFHTGDLLQTLLPASGQSESAKIDALLRTLHPPLGFYCVRGDGDGIPAGLTSFGSMTILESSQARIDIGQTHISILGLTLQESAGGGETAQRIERWLAQTPPGDFTLLIGHRPDYIAQAQACPIDLCLAGHTHGGQIRLPLIGPLYTASSIPRRLARGFHTVGQTRLNVSAGIGAEHAAGLPSIRLNCPPEMTLIELRPVRSPTPKP